MDAGRSYATDVSRARRTPRSSLRPPAPTLARVRSASHARAVSPTHSTPSSSPLVLKLRATADDNSEEEPALLQSSLVLYTTTRSLPPFSLLLLDFERRRERMASRMGGAGGGGNNKACLNDYHIMKKIGSGSYGAAFLVMHKVRMENQGLDLHVCKRY